MNRTTTASRAEVERQLEIQAHMHREALPADCASQTMARVRLAKAEASRRALTPAQRFAHAPAAVALAGLVVVTAIMAWSLVPASITPSAASDDATKISTAEPTPPGIRNPLRTQDLFVVRTVSLKDPLVAPFRTEANAILERGRDLGVAMLSTLPARPRAWAEPLENSSER